MQTRISGEVYQKGWELTAVDNPDATVQELISLAEARETDKGNWFPVEVRSVGL